MHLNLCRKDYPCIHHVFHLWSQDREAASSVNIRSNTRNRGAGHKKGWNPSVIVGYGRPTRVPRIPRLHVPDIATSSYHVPSMFMFVWCPMDSESSHRGERKNSARLRSKLQVLAQVPGVQKPSIQHCPQSDCGIHAIRPNGVCLKLSLSFH